MKEGDDPECQRWCEMMLELGMYRDYGAAAADYRRLSWQAENMDRTDYPQPAKDYISSRAAGHLRRGK